MIVKENSIVQYVVQIKNETICQCKRHFRCKKDYSWNPSTCTYENNGYLKSIVDYSVIACN